MNNSINTGEEYLIKNDENGESHKILLAHPQKILSVQLLNKTK